MNKLQITRTNGNIPKSLPGEDHISGFLAYVGTLPSGFTAEAPIQAVSTIETAEDLGITAEASSWEIKVIYHQLGEIFRLNPGISLYVGLFSKPEEESGYTFAEIKQLQNYAGGRIRQVGVYCGDNLLKKEDITTLQGIADTLEAQDMPLSILYAPKVADITNLPTDVAGPNKKNVSVVIAQAGNGKAADLFADTANTKKNSVSAIGVFLGILSSASVQESIAWVKRFPTGIDLPAFADGKLYRDIDKAVIESLDTARYLFFTTYSGYSGSYINDSHTMDAAISDYAYIESVRTMDKAVRGIRTYLLPELGGTLYIDQETGKLQYYTVTHLTNVANQALEDMERAGELSGYAVEINPDQNVLSTSTVEIIIKQVPVGIMRKINVKIGFAEKV